MKVEEFLDLCIGHGVSISMAGENLRVTRGDDTPSELIDQIRQHKAELIAWFSQGAGQGNQHVHEISCVDRAAGRFPLSYSQSRLWFVDRLEQSWQHNMSQQLRLKGPLQEAALEHAINALVARHEVLRTTFVEIDGTPFQIVHPRRSVTLQRISLAGTAPGQADTEIERLAAAEARKIFDLERECMLRVVLIAVSENDHVLLFTAHHIAVDGASMAVLVKDCMAFYEAAMAGRPAGLPELPLQYVDYAHWQRGVVQRRYIEGALERALVRLDGMPQLHALPLDAQRPANQVFTGDSWRSMLDPELMSGLTALCRMQGVTLFMLLQAAYALLIGRWSNEDEVVIGSPTAGRTHIELHPLCGFFVNNMVLRNRLRAGSFLDYLATVRDDVLAVLDDQHLPFEMLVEALKPERNLSYSPMFQLVFVLNNTESPQLVLDGIEIESSSSSSIKLDLELAASETAEGILLNWIYADTLFRKDTIVRLAESFEVLLRAIVEAPASDIFHLPVVPAPDLALLARWANGPVLASEANTVYGLFTAQAQATPDAVAVRCGDATISYRDLYVRSNRLAAYLHDEGVTTSSRVGICMRRSIEQVIGILGILAAGAAYVPLEPSHPRDLVDWIVEDAGLELVLMESAMLENLSLTGIDVTLMDEALSPKWMSGFAADAPALSLPGDDALMYVLYTSGSTGRPKGVMVPHEGVLNYLRYGLQAYRMARHAGAVVGTPLCFDATVTTLFLPLISGKQLILLPEAQLDMIEGLAGLLFETPDPLLFKLTPAHLDLLETQAERASGRTPVAHTLVVGGEQFMLASARRWKERLLPNAVFINEYGPTETVVGCTTFEVASTDDLDSLAGRAAVAIGRPIANTTLAVLNAQQIPCPIGAIGELYIGGPGVTRGYLNRPGLNEERFLAFERDDMPVTRWYRSGDLVRYLPDGVLEFIGRADKQVKIRGHRIELGEIEATLESLGGIKKSAVVVDTASGSQRLVAFVAVEPDVPHQADALAYLRRKLPRYMLPDVVQVVDALPLTVNGKLDTKALLSMLSRPAPDTVEPETETERRLRDIWVALLGLQCVSLQANFFEIGGHSLLAARMVSAIKHEFGCSFVLKDVFELRNIREMALQVDFLTSVRQGDVAEENSQQEELEW
jgi:amino acid adenylation domain-containing protein